MHISWPLDLKHKYIVSCYTIWYSAFVSKCVCVCVCVCVCSGGGGGCEGNTTQHAYHEVSLESEKVSRS